VGALTSGLDVLERHAYGAALQLGVGEGAGRWQGAFAYARRGPGSLLFDASYTRDELLAPACCVTDHSLEAGVTMVARRWRRAASLRGGVEYDRTGGAARWGLVGGLGWSSAAQPALAISPTLGTRASLTVRRRWRTDVVRSTTEWTARVSTYRAWSGGGFAPQVTGLRVSAGTVAGNAGVAFGVGGNPGEAFELMPGIVFGGSRSFPLRGATGSEFIARRVVTASLEHRVPLALVGRGLPWLLPAQLDRVSLAAFVDGAATWLGTTRGEHGSVGAELVFDLGIGYDLPLRVRFGAARRLDRGAGTAYAAVGAAF
jgi:hypothetical protein